MIYKAKKSLGQNFLKSEIALKKIIEAGEIKPGDNIVEWGWFDINNLPPDCNSNVYEIISSLK